LRSAGTAPATPLDIGTHLSVPLDAEGRQGVRHALRVRIPRDEDISLRDVWRLRAVADVLAKRLEPKEGGEPAAHGA
jgi:hypothetical protein